MTVVLLDTSDLGEVEQMFSTGDSTQRLSAADPHSSTRTRIVRTQIGSLVFDEIDFSGDVTLNADPLPDMLLCRVHAGVITQQFPDGETVRCSAGQVNAAGAYPDIPFCAGIAKARYDTVAVSRDLLSQVAAGPPEGGEDDAPVRLTGTVPVSPEANNHLVKVIDHVRRVVLDDPHAAHQPLIASAVELYLAAVVLATYPNTAMLEPTATDRHDTTPALLARAVAYIDDNADRDITLAEVARAVYVTPRALQLMFRKHRDCTPTEYLRRVRLHHAHLDLVRHNRSTTTVSQIAQRWGFGHVGRFAVYYRQHYRQSPHDTLRA